MRMTAAFQLIIFVQLAAKVHQHVMSYGEYLGNHDLYFDRMVPMRLRDGWGRSWTVATGIFLSSDRILTSYNPFRSFIHNKEVLSRLSVVAKVGRAMGGWSWLFGYLGKHYTTSTTRVACGRQIQFLPDEFIGNDLWHGADHKNCPLHDLIVFRVYGEYTISKYKMGQITMANYPESKRVHYHTDIFVAELAGENDFMGASFKYCELRDGWTLQVYKFEADDDAVLDCDLWMPRKWGRLICILNKDNRKTLTSGAMLVSNNKVFGVGSFILRRGVTSMLVFTDVRPYKDQILKTCTYADSGEKRPFFFSDLFNWDWPWRSHNNTDMDTSDMNTTNMDTTNMDITNMDTTNMDTTEYMDTTDMDTTNMDPTDMDTADKDGLHNVTDLRVSRSL